MPEVRNVWAFSSWHPFFFQRVAAEEQNQTLDVGELVGGWMHKRFSGANGPICYANFMFTLATVNY